MESVLPDVAAPAGVAPRLWSRLHWADRRGGGRLLRSLAFGLIVTLVAIALRLVLGSEVGREQIVFSYPAVIVATLLFGIPAGTAAATVCVVVAWYYVVPPVHSFAIRDSAALTTLGVDVFTSAVLVVTVGALRAAIDRYQALAAALQASVHARTAERDRLWDRSPELLATVDGGTVDAINPALASALAAGSRRRLPLSGLIAAEDAPVLDATMRRLAAGAPAAAFEARLPGAGAARWVAWSAVLDGGHLHLVGRDVTAERACHDQLAQSQKMEAVGQMTGGLAHDFANLLLPVSMSLDLIRRRHGDEPRTRTLLDAAEEATERARALVRRLLDFARRSTRAPAPLDLGVQLEALQPLLRQSAGDRTVELRVAPGLPPVIADANALDSALLNLVVNARDASPPGSAILVATEVAADGGVSVRVADAGAGMDAPTLARARDAFFTTKPAAQGTGLGLAMVQAFMNAAGGALRIDSRPGAGTVVHLDFPPAAPAATAR